MDYVLVTMLVLAWCVAAPALFLCSIEESEYSEQG